MALKIIYINIPGIGRNLLWRPTPASVAPEIAAAKTNPFIACNWLQTRRWPFVRARSTAIGAWIIYQARDRETALAGRQAAHPRLRRYFWVFFIMQLTIPFILNKSGACVLQTPTQRSRSVQIFSTHQPSHARPRHPFSSLISPACGGAPTHRTNIHFAPLQIPP